jgi:hypothetical protein
MVQLKSHDDALYQKNPCLRFNLKDSSSRLKQQVGTWNDESKVDCLVELVCIDYS